MPVSVRRKKKGEKGKPWKIIEPSGKVVGQSNTKRDAEASARIRNSNSKK